MNVPDIRGYPNAEASYCTNTPFHGGRSADKGILGWDSPLLPFYLRNKYLFLCWSPCCTHSWRCGAETDHFSKGEGCGAPDCPWSLGAAVWHPASSLEGPIVFLVCFPQLERQWSLIQLPECLASSQLRNRTRLQRASQ